MIIIASPLIVKKLGLPDRDVILIYLCYDEDALLHPEIGRGAESGTG